MVNWADLMSGFLDVVPSAIMLGVVFFIVVVAYRFLRRFVEGVGGGSGEIGWDDLSPREQEQWKRDHGQKY